MSEVIDMFEEGTVIEDVPLFPLPEVVLFPRVVLPLHIFEPRYKAMTEAAIAGSRLIAVGRILEGEEAIDEHGHPPVAPLLGVGQIVHHEQLDNGRYNIALVGRGRAHFEELPFEAPYRRIRATIIGEKDETPFDQEAAALVAAATRFASVVKRKEPKFDMQIPEGAAGGTLADAIASVLLISGDARQHVFDADSPRERVRRCTEALVVQEAMMSERSTFN